MNMPATNLSVPSFLDTVPQNELMLLRLVILVVLRADMTVFCRLSRPWLLVPRGAAVPVQHRQNRDRDIRHIRIQFIPHQL